MILYKDFLTIDAINEFIEVEIPDKIWNIETLNDKYRIWYSIM